jgi:putative transcriptional regulator
VSGRNTPFARVFAGGPVQPELGFVLHSAEYRRAETVDVDGRAAMTASRQVLLDIGHSQGPEKSLFALGYAGWGLGQLEGEVARHDWFTTPEEPKHFTTCRRRPAGGSARPASLHGRPKTAFCAGK